MEAASVAAGAKKEKAENYRLIARALFSIFILVEP
jgi:hypothetical protein